MNIIYKWLALGVFASLFLSAFWVGCDSNTNETVMQAESENSQFEILVEHAEAGISLKGIKGTAWKDLTFAIEEGEWQAIDEFGMTAIGAPEQEGEKLADFLFSIRRTPSGMELKSVKGTAWTDLAFALNEGEQQAIDDLGTAIR